MESEWTSWLIFNGAKRSSGDLTGMQNYQRQREVDAQNYFPYRGSNKNNGVQIKARDRSYNGDLRGMFFCKKD